MVNKCSLPANGRSVLSRPLSSGGKHYSLSIEAPITKVINIILAAQENQPSYIVQALDKVFPLYIFCCFSLDTSYPQSQQSVSMMVVKMTVKLDAWVDKI